MVDFLSVLARRWRIVVVAALLGVAVATAITSQLTPSYRATSQLFVALASGDSAAEQAQGQLFAANRVKSYPDLAESPLVLDPVIAELGLDTTAEDLAGQVSAEAPANTVLLEVSVDDPSPQLAADLANAVSLQLGKAIEDLDKTSPSAESPVRVSQVRPATTPEDPRTPIPLLNLAIGLLAGLGLGLAAASLRDTLDNSLKDDGDVQEAVGLPVLGTVPVNASIDRAPVIDQGTPDPVWAESYRKLRTNLSYLDPDHPPRTLLVTSALPGDGKTVTAANLAASLAQGGQTVCLVEADLRRPSVARMLGLVPDVGVTTVVAGKATRAEVTQRASGMDVITSGPVPPNPSELLGSQAFRSFVEELLGEYDVVVVDTPPLIAVTDAAVAAVAADAVIVVARARKTSRPDLRKAIEGLRNVDAHVVGVVLNQVALSSGSYYQYQYESRPGGGRRNRKK
ncbi:polysaccharide biosynthesis tyrosine autokinase [Nocardioides sp. SOB77]|uniref:Polysaccharide biosynthesis tyrosine autokinase n=1 Tax=Nocardioides oceani TaxID=3058369 RepID=A0ABT8FG75_9ACTN|nr:polysaccharide biosynthesis tyrosine autokinase [Nocardioides oceani]MDN4173609.1 polysaccharide biosynthesis tyrosine autokinase [Nocardioides oceani]